MKTPHTNCSRRLTLSGLATVVVLVVGCLGPQRSDYQSSRSFAPTDDTPTFDVVWESAQQTLRKHRFRLDRVDRRAGIITTMPVTSQSLFEFWRHDVDTRRDLWESTLNPLRRWVEVRCTKDDAGETKLAVVVHKERFSSPDRQFNSTGAAYQYFGNSLPSTAGLVRVTAEYDKWIDRGRDHAMEEYLIGKIARRAGM